MTLYTEEEMIIIFKDVFDLDISKREMSNYKPELVQKIYTFFLKDFGACIEKLSVMPLNAPPLMQHHADMFRNTGFLLRLGKCVQYFLNLIYDNSEFEIIDIFLPDPGRTKRFFSKFIDFYCHIRENVNSYEEVENEVTLKREYHERLQKEIEYFKKEIKKCEMKNAEKEVSLEKAQKTIEDVKGDVETRQAMKTRLKGRLEGLKQEIMFLVTNIKEKELVILEATEKVDTLKTEVMREGECEEVKEKEGRLSSFRASNAELKKILKELKHNLQMLQKADGLLKDTLTPVVEEYELMLRKKEEIFSKIEERKKEIGVLHEKNEELARCEQIQKDKLAFLQHERSQTQQSRKLKKRGLEEDIKQLRLTFEEQERKMKEYEIVKKNIISEYESTEKEISSLKETHDQFLNDFEFYMKKLTTEFKENSERDVEKVSKMFSSKKE